MVVSLGPYASGQVHPTFDLDRGAGGQRRDAHGGPCRAVGRRSRSSYNAFTVAKFPRSVRKIPALATSAQVAPQSAEHRADVGEHLRRLGLHAARHQHAVGIEPDLARQHDQSPAAHRGRVRARRRAARSAWAAARTLISGGQRRGR